MWNQLREMIDKENDRLRYEAPEEVVKVIHYRVIESESGTRKLAMGNWFFSFSDIRYVAAYLYQIMNLALDESYTLSQIKLMVSAMISQPADFAGYCGFKTLRKFVFETIEALKEIDDRDNLLGLLNSVFLYASHLHTWINHYFPWSYTFAFPVRTAEEIQDMRKYT